MERLFALGWKRVCRRGNVDELLSGWYSSSPKDPGILLSIVLFAMLLDEIVVDIGERIVNAEFLPSVH